MAASAASSALNSRGARIQVGTRQLRRTGVPSTSSRVLPHPVYVLRTGLFRVTALQSSQSRRAPGPSGSLCGPLQGARYRRRPSASSTLSRVADGVNRHDSPTGSMTDP
jgi:hypothetical protein